MERNEEIETGRVKIENEEMQGPRLQIPFLSEPVETLDSDLGPRSWVDNSLSSLRISSLGLMRTGPDPGDNSLSSLRQFSWTDAVMAQIRVDNSLSSLRISSLGLMRIDKSWVDNSLSSLRISSLGLMRTWTNPGSTTLSSLISSLGLMRITNPDLGSTPVVAL